MQKQSVLIVGAGAMGVVMGYHLGLAGAAVTFLVRPTRLDALNAAQILYCYDDATLKTYAGFRTVTAFSEIADESFDFVLVTLDGATCRSAEGTQLLKELGDAVRKMPAVVIIGGVGIGLREHYLRTTGLAEARLLEGTLGCLSYQVQRADMPVHPPTDAQQLAKASIAYRQFPSKVGFMLAGHPAEAAKAFAALYDQCGVSRCSIMNATLYDIISTVFFPMMAVSDIAGWPQAKDLGAPLLSLCRGAMKDITRLPRHGWMGKLLSPVISKMLVVKLLTKMERDSLPMDFIAFNRFHHGGKVREQDIQVMRNCVVAGQARGQKMAKLKELVRRYEDHCGVGTASLSSL